MPKLSSYATLTAAALTDLVTLISGGVNKLISVKDIKKNIYVFSVYRNAAFNTVAATNTKIPFDTEDYDDNSNFDSTTNNRYVAPVDGVYHFDTVVRATSTAVGQAIDCMLYKNGVMVASGNRNCEQFGVVLIGASCHKDLKLVAGDYIETYCYTTVAMAVNVSAAQQAYLTGHLVAPV